MQLFADDWLDDCPPAHRSKCGGVPGRSPIVSSAMKYARTFGT
jgi:hypothetical protein